MNDQKPSDATEFDRYAAVYDEALAKGIAVSGEDKIYFVRRRLEWLKTCLVRLGVSTETVMEFGCGTGASLPHLTELLRTRLSLGVDVSAKSLELAQQAYGSPQARFLTIDQYAPVGEIDVVTCNGVFHHISPERRATAVDYIYRCLKPGGLFALWENNPWNPGTRYVMSRIPFDKDAITLTPPQSRRLLEDRGFVLLRTDFLFIFPRTLAWLRMLERRLSRLPFGAQYQVLARKPDDDAAQSP